MCNGAFTISRCRPSLLHVQAQLNTSIMQTDRLHLRSQWEYSFVTLIVNVFFRFAVMLYDQRSSSDNCFYGHLLYIQYSVLFVLRLFY